MIQKSRISSVKLVQQKHFKEEYKWLRFLKGKHNDSRTLNKNCRISHLGPFIDESDVICVGGRNIKKSHISDDCKHQTLLPKKGKVSDPIKHCHSHIAHGGCRFTLNEILGGGYWIVSANSAVKKVIFNYVEYRRFRGRVGEQKMASLPACRSKEACLGPFYSNEESTVKQYGAMFTCMATRAAYIEVNYFLDTGSFILTLRRLAAR